MTGTSTLNGLRIASNGLTIASNVNGPLQANNGLVSATTTIGTLYGGTGASSFSYGLVGSNGGASALTTFATSTLYGTGTGGQILAWNNGVPSWVATTTFSAPLVFSNGNVTITQATSGTNGYLSSTDFNTFNNKISSTSLSGGTGISYVSATGVITNTDVFGLIRKAVGL